MQITSGQQYNVGEKPTVILYIYINRRRPQIRSSMYAPRTVYDDPSDKKMDDSLHQ